MFLSSGTLRDDKLRYRLFNGTRRRRLRDDIYSEDAYRTSTSCLGAGSMRCVCHFRHSGAARQTSTLIFIYSSLHMKHLQVRRSRDLLRRRIDGDLSRRSSAQQSPPRLR